MVFFLEITLERLEEIVKFVKDNNNLNSPIPNSFKLTERIVLNVIDKEKVK